jgi:hypothetical protein
VLGLSDGVSLGVSLGVVDGLVESEADGEVDGLTGGDPGETPSVGSARVELDGLHDGLVLGLADPGLDNPELADLDVALPGPPEPPGLAPPPPGAFGA